MPRAARQAVDEARSRSSLDARACASLCRRSASARRQDSRRAARRARRRRSDPRRRGGARGSGRGPGRRDSRQVAGDTLIDGAIVILLFSGPLDVLVRRRDGLARRRAARHRDPNLKRTASSRSAGVRRSSSTTATSASASRRSATRSRSSRTGTPDFYLRTPTRFDRNPAWSFLGFVPEGATVQVTVAATDEIVDGARASIADAVGELSRGAAPERRAAVLVRDPPIPPRDPGGTRDRAGPRGARAATCRSPASTASARSRRCPGRRGSQFHNATMVAVLLGSAAA